MTSLTTSFTGAGLFDRLNWQVLILLLVLLVLDEDARDEEEHRRKIKGAARKAAPAPLPFRV